MQKTRTKSQTRGYPLAVTHGMANGLQAALVFGVHLDVSKQGEVVAFAQLAEMRGQHSIERELFTGQASKFVGVGRVSEQLDSAFFQQRRLGRQLAALLVLFRKPARGYLAGLNVRLVEGVDADDGAGHGGGKLPAKEFLSQVVDVGDVNAKDGLPSFE